MKKGISFLVPFLAFLLCLFNTSKAWGATSYTLTGTSPNKTLTITGSGDMTDFSESENAPWYVERSNIKTIIISDGITHVGAYAFRGITYSSITIPVSVESFGNRAFWGISSGSAKNVYYKGTPNEWAQIDFAMPASYASSHPFYQGSDDASYATSNHIYFYNQKTTETTKIVFTPGLEEIKPYVFWHAGNITNVNIPHSVTSIGKKAFWKCSNLCRIYINNTSAPTTGTDVFSGIRYNATLNSSSWLYLPAYANASTSAPGYRRAPWYDSSNSGNGASCIGYYGTDKSKSGLGNNFSSYITNSKVYPTSGTVDGISWVLDEDGVMTFSGSGAITTNFSTGTGSDAVYPWLRFSELTDKVVITGGVTGLSNALANFSALREITISQAIIPTAASTLPTYIHGQKVNVYIDNSLEEDPNLSSAPWNNSKFSKIYTTTFCNDPTDLTISSIGATTATASWTDESGDTWKYICKPASEEEPTSSEWASATSTNSKSVTLSTLTPGTRYTFYLISDCGSMTSNVIDENFTTDCNIIASASLPWNEGFEGSTNNQTPLCWGELKSAGSSGYVQAATVAKKTGTYGLRIAGGRSVGGNSVVTAVFPDFEENISDLELSFYYKAEPDVIDEYYGNEIHGKLQLGYVTNPNSTSSFVAFGDPLAQQQNFTLVEGINMSSAPSGARFAIRYTGGEAFAYAAVDDITVREKPSCNKPTSVAVTADSETAEGATITWDANGMSAWKLQVSEGDAASWGDDINVATNSKVLTGLNAHTLYYVRVKADCGGGSVSEWSDNVSFTTLCGTINVNATTSWNIDFEGLGDHVIPECWDNSASTTTSSWGSGYIWGTFERNSNKMLSMDNSVCDGGTALINTPSIAIPDDGKTYELTFDYSNMALAGNNMLVKISANGGAFADKETYYSSGNVSSYPGDFVPATISLADYSGQTIKIQFFANPTSGTSSEGGAMFVDNVSVHKVPSCFPPTDLAAGNLTANSARISWTAGSTESAWRLQYRAVEGDWSAEQAVSGSAQRDLTGLSANTEYFVRVKAYCDAEDQSNWSDVLSFTTLCAAAAMPFSEEFSSASELPSCWEATTSSVYGWSAYEKSGAYSVQLRTGSSGNAELRMPAIALSEDAILRFEWKNVNGTNVNLYISTDGGSTKALLPNDLSGEHADWTTKIFDLSAYTGQTALIYFVANFTTLNQYAYLDDVEVVARPCDMILSISAAPVTGGATISWSGDVKKLQYKLSTADAWTSVNIASGDYAGPKTITGLTPARTYQVRLLPACSEEIEANWTSPISFTSKAAESIPYSNDFEAETPGEVPFNWSRISASEYPQVSHDAYAYKEGESFGYQGNSIKFYGVNDQIIVFPEFDADLGDLVVSFHYRNRDCTMQLGYVESDGSTFVALETLPNQTGYGELPFEKDLFGISSDAANLAIRYSNAAGATAQCWVDNVEVREATCGQPTGLAFDNVTANSAHISWSASTRGGESNYQYIRQIWSDDDPNWASATLISSSVTELNLTDLTANKEYEFYLRSYCGESDQSTPVKISFKTLMKDEVFEDKASATNNESRLADLDGQTINMIIERPLLLNGDYCTICLPFDLSASEIANPECPLHGFVVKEFEHSENKEGEVNLYLRQVTSIEAGKPYFVRYAGATSDDRLTPLRFNAVNIKLSTPVEFENEDCTPHGVFNPFALTGGDNTTFFLSSNNTLYYASANGTMNGFRAYVHINPSSPLGMAVRRGAPMRICESTQTPTGMESIQKSDVRSQKILRDGQLIILRDGKEYNVQGQIVK